jgi:hypothetical protein
MKTDQRELTDDESRYLRTRLDSLRYSCGCRSGMVALLFSLMASSYYFLHVAGAIYSSRQKILYIFLVCLGSAAVGKIIGISLSRILYISLKKRIKGSPGEAKRGQSLT